MSHLHGAGEDLAAIAARNNAEWCEIVCELHGIRGTFHPDAWASPVRTPEFYPDAVTLVRSASPERLLGQVDPSSGCSIKDSFADLDLGPWGFRPLFEATWIHRPAETSVPAAGGLRWEPVRDAEDLHEWEIAWSSGASRPRLFLPTLLDRDDVAVLGAYGDRGLVAGAILNLGTDVAGLSNVFASGADLADVYAGAVATAARLFPGNGIVGWESGAFLEAAERVGFEKVGRLVVWHRA